MLGRKKGFSASQSKRMSKRMQSSTVGSHVVRDAPTRRGKHAPSNASSVDFANMRRANKATRGYVRHVGTSAQSGESDSAYSRRVSRLGYVQEIQRKARHRRILFFALVAVLVVAVAAGVGAYTYFSSSDSKLALGSSNAKEALVAPAEGEPYYVLCAAELGSAAKARGAATDAYLLVRVDEGARVLSFASIPANLDVRLSDGKDHPLYDARGLGGDAELIRQVAKLAEVDVAHFAATDEEGLSGMVDAVGGVALTLAEEVDDPRAGTVVLPAGEQTLGGDEALVYLRALNFSGGFDAASANRVAFTLALAQRALASEGLSFASLVGEAGDYLSCDFTSSQLIALGDALRPLDQVTTYVCALPGYATDAAEPLFEYYEDEWADMLARFKAGEDPAIVDSSAAGVNPAEVTVEVRNGAGTTGAAGRLGEMLASAGFKVEGTGNVDDGTVYPETFVIYKDGAYEGAAKAVARAASGGRVINGGDFYTFDTNVLVIIGKDWMPVS
ncbi:LCP family protein [Adlercreutzia sp. ZJ242]|uniref:LCP family protein n=1 Tax=Adlercreutzia sp. ZJ242 TaxID=2709409 RepID=UPI0013EB3C4C|nr:LCP family protein [Adlercreutzia sp. ZJ242]